LAGELLAVPGAEGAICVENQAELSQARIEKNGGGIVPWVISHRF